MIVVTIFVGNLPDLTMMWAPLYSVAGKSFTSHASYKEYLEKSAKDTSKTANPNLLLIHVDVSGDTNEFHKMKKYPY